jgi:hypothetical protein
MGRFNKPPMGVLLQSRSAAERPYHQAYEEGDAYESSIQSAGEEPPNAPVIVRNARYGGEGLTASLGEAPLNKFVVYEREQRAQYLQGTRQTPNMHDPTRDGPFRAAIRSLAFTLRKEYLQEAQRFPGAHTYYQAGSAQATGQPGNRMLPPRRSRLTMRPEPRSYGSQTEKIA